MKWTHEELDVEKWHPWFAWHPVHVYESVGVSGIIHHWVWLEWIERRWGNDGWDSGDWEYQL